MEGQIFGPDFLGAGADYLVGARLSALFLAGLSGGPDNPPPFWPDNQPLDCNNYIWEGV
jgi:hypothetical protein